MFLKHFQRLVRVRNIQLYSVISDPPHSTTLSLYIYKAVADAGAGGQVLMDQATFLAVKERLEELGAVDHTGLNPGRLNKVRPAKWICW